MFLVDSHCHLNLLNLSTNNDDIEQVVKRATENNVQYLLNVSVDLDDFPTILNTAKAYSCVSASVGVHPNETTRETSASELIALAQDEKVIAIGETGLDYFRVNGDLGWQQQRFREHIIAAKTTQKPLIIHTRQAKTDTIAILKEAGVANLHGVIHCFTEDVAFAKLALDLGFYISFSGIVTFKNATHIQEAAKYVPLDRILIETDSPYLAPEPKRGKPNEPSYVRFTAAFIARLRNETLDDFAEHTTNNFFTLFKGANRPNV